MNKMLLNTKVSKLWLAALVLTGGCQSLTEPVIDTTNSAVESLRLSKRVLGKAMRTASVPSTLNYDLDESTLLTTGWRKAFEDDFDVTPASTNSKWDVWVGGAFNNEMQMYTADTENLSVAADPDKAGNNLLVIKAVKEKVTGPKYRQDVDATPTNFDFTSARIESKSLFTPTRTEGQVRMSARIKLATGYGMWPAFWAYGDKWPTNGEIDILEARGHKPNDYQTNYFFGRKADQNLVMDQETYLTTSTSLTDGWHVYEVIWTKDALTFMLDGEVVDVKSGGYVPNLFGKLEKVTLNLAVGGNFFWEEGTIPTADQINIGETDGVMQVDWVKVFLKK
ncbi:glycoside hydrolase family 16 protein [Telluribacter humicola]|uniref:glycoside hydrolase family 16 protein n=1 Tax=Telluribacter humicola TaxID=1720261 RepID=UPI001A9770A3|nr:glycoside hydrolase family 16 protein [Telluribacter humicola]